MMNDIGNGIGIEIIDSEIEEQLTELLDDLYEKWKDCSCGVGTDEDRRGAFLNAIKRRLERGFSIITDPGRFGEEVEMERILGKMYKIWKNYMKESLGDDVTVDVFINSVRYKLGTVHGFHWKRELGL